MEIVEHVAIFLCWCVRFMFWIGVHAGMAQKLYYQQQLYCWLVEAYR